MDLLAVGALVAPQNLFSLIYLYSSLLTYSILKDSVPAKGPLGPTPHTHLTSASVLLYAPGKGVYAHQLLSSKYWIAGRISMGRDGPFADILSLCPAWNRRICLFGLTSSSSHLALTLCCWLPCLSSLRYKGCGSTQNTSTRGSSIVKKQCENPAKYGLP